MRWFTASGSVAFGFVFLMQFSTPALGYGPQAHSVEMEKEQLTDTSPITGIGDSIWSFYFNGDQGLFGVEFDGECFYLAGSNSLGDSNMVYVFDKLGNYLREFGQKNPQSGWGWWDLAYRADKDYFFGSDDSMITAFDRFGNILYEFRGPYNVNMALAWDTQHMWVGFYQLPIVKTDLEGNVVATYDNSFKIQGLAWDDASPGSPWLWVSTWGENWNNRIYQFDPVKGQYTGTYFVGAYPMAAGGLAFSCEWDSTRAVLFELCQLAPDHVVAYDMGPIETILNAIIDIKPEVLNLKSKGRWVTCYIELFQGYSVEEIDRLTVAITKIDEQLLSSPIRTEGPSSVGDYDGDSIPDLMVKFSRQELTGHLQGKYGVVTVLVSGELYNGVEFEGSDTLRVIEPPQSNRNPMVEGNRSAYTFALHQNWPSPFYNRTYISYQIPKEAPVRLAIYDIRGRLVKTLAVDTQAPGSYTVEWQANDDFGHPLPAGVYLYRLDAHQWSATRKTVLVR